MAKGGASSGSGIMQSSWSKGNLPASGYSSFGKSQLEDPMAQLVARIAELRGHSGSFLNPAGNKPGAREELSMLSDLYAKMQQQMDMKTEAMKPPIEQRSAVMSAGFGGGGPSVFGGMERGGSEPMMMTAVLDPYKKIREDAIKAAQGYLKIKNPHLVSSLKE